MQYESAKLREERAQAISTMKALLDTAKTEERELTEDEATEFDSLELRIDSLDKGIARAEKVEQLAPSLEQRAAVPAEEPADSHDYPLTREGVRASDVRVGREPLTYARDNAHASYISDLYRAQRMGDAG